MEKQRRRITWILTILLCGIYLTILICINLFNYSANIRRQRWDIRNLISEVGLEAFCEYPRTNPRLEKEEYCVIQIQKGKQPQIISNYMDDYSEKKLVYYTKKIQKRQTDGHVGSLVFVKKKISDNIKLIVFMSNDFAVENSKNLILFSVAVFALGSIALMAISVLLSKWLMRPVEQGMEASKDFISGASHELKTPLTIIRVNVELLREEYGDSQQLEYIRQETEKMNSLVGEMLTLVRMDAETVPNNYEDFDLSSAMLDVVLPFESVAFESKLKLEFQIDNNLIYHGNQVQLMRVMSVLLNNAMSYTEAGGNVFVQVYYKNKRFILSVSNTGKPIPEHKQKKLFDRFYREKDDKEPGEQHFGLGLSIADSIVKRHHGKIFVECAGGKNTFTVSLPQNR